MFASPSPLEEQAVAFVGLYFQPMIDRFIFEMEAGARGELEILDFLGFGTH